ncbi:hypothetical protein MLD38_024243 [Melastoma candidum]|nr:hypothetical protein MLD38_024243 [Melastoma candidum]
MEKQSTLLLFCLFFSCRYSGLGVSEGTREQPQQKIPVRIFVFGDSYADTGNWDRSGGSWHLPYGITFPGKPSGRFSDGRVLTDYFASFFGAISPPPYNQRSYTMKSIPQYGMNFAYGGTGVFNTLVNKPNMTTQIEFFKDLVERKVYSKEDLAKSIALVSVAGNDYAAYARGHQDQQGLQVFISALIDQLSVNLKRIHGLGVAKIAVTGLPPLGCLPQLTSYVNYKNCSAHWNSLAESHNKKLEEMVEESKNEKGGPGHVLVLDLQMAFTSALIRHGLETGSLESVLKPCCLGAKEGYFCGSLDEKGERMYAVCDEPQKSFFWDDIHPSQNGWASVSSLLRSTLEQLN